MFSFYTQLSRWSGIHWILSEVQRNATCVQPVLKKYPDSTYGTETGSVFRHWWQFSSSRLQHFSCPYYHWLHFSYKMKMVTSQPPYSFTTSAHWFVGMRVAAVNRVSSCIHDWYSLLSLAVLFSVCFSTSSMLLYSSWNSVGGME